MINNLFSSICALVSDIKGAFYVFSEDTKEIVKSEIRSVKNKVKKLNPLAKSSKRGRRKKA